MVLTTVRNDGPFPMTVLGVDETRTLPWVRATFRAADPTPEEIGFPSGRAALDAVRNASLVLEPGETAEVLVTFDALPTAIPTEGGRTQVLGLPLVVRSPRPRVDADRAGAARPARAGQPHRVGAARARGPVRRRTVGLLVGGPCQGHLEHDHLEHDHVVRRRRSA